MNAATKLAAFAAVVATTFGAAAVVGAAVGPINVSGANHGSPSDDTEGGQRPRGLAISEDGYRLVAGSTTVTAGTPSTFSFRIVDDAGAAVKTFDALHERPLHLIVLSRNLVDYLHLHPTIDRDGLWTVGLPALTPGSYRVFADFQPTGAANVTLGTDVTVIGDVSAVDVPPPSAVATVDDYTVTLAATPHVGDTELAFTVALAGEPVRTDPYLGAAGHLVAIRSGDLAYLHVHPHEDDAAPVVTFTGEFPTAGTYRLFLDFSHAGEVRTAAFTVVVDDAEPAADDDPTPTTPHDEGH
ncbi:MAG: hypothetical protein ABIW84_02545 [Ilumatobacteraceae bacterium]